MKWVITLIPLWVTYYTFTYGLWVLKKGNRIGGISIFTLAALALGISIYAIFIRTGF